MGAWSGLATVTFHGYIEGTRLAGGRPLVIPADPYLADDPDDVLDLLDGVVFVGGGDVAPAPGGGGRRRPRRPGAGGGGPRPAPGPPQRAPRRGRAVADAARARPRPAGARDL